MSAPTTPVSAEHFARIALGLVEESVKDRTSFILEAGAGAGKTYSLVHALRFLVDKKGSEFLRAGRRVACITFTNAATEEIESRIDRHPAVLVSTIHSFCWSLLSCFPAALGKEIVNLDKWPERLEESGGLRNRSVEYSLGYPSAKSDDHVSLSHDDVLSLMVRFLVYPKFRSLLVDRFPVLLIDEYQDTDRELVGALSKHFLNGESKLLLGFFGDHWQRIYANGCGEIDNSTLKRIDKHSNFRSSPQVVDALNLMRPELPQVPSEDAPQGSVAVYHTNSWSGERQTGGHWKGDLPVDDSHKYLQMLIGHLESEGWDFKSDSSKVLMLTHNVLAGEQGYKELLAIYRYNDSLIKKEDDQFAYFADILEPATAAYAEHKYGAMISILGGHRPAITSGADKRAWSESMKRLTELQNSGTVGEVLDHLEKTERPMLPAAIKLRNQQMKDYEAVDGVEMPRWMTELSQLRDIPYSQVRALVQFINGYTPFSTKHGAKGLEFENVLVVVGRGWSQYNFNQMLEWASTGVPSGKEATFERSRNLFSTLR